MHPSVLKNEQLLKKNYKKLEKPPQKPLAGWKHSWNVPCTSPSAATSGGRGAELHPQGDAAKRVYLLGEGRNHFWQLFLRGRYWETTRSFAELSQLSALHKCMGCDCYFRAQKNARYLAKGTVLP